MPSSSAAGATMLAVMASSFHTVAIEALNLGEADRLRLAAELIDSVEGPADPAWERAWSAELDRRAAAADARGGAGAVQAVAARNGRRRRRVGGVSRGGWRPVLGVTLSRVAD